ncbi:MAG: hypothetical protein ACOYI2_00300 [Bacillota bacterium]|jgi:hypothetical protein|nr:hypothetical protein [Clostridia bacterium]
MDRKALIKTYIKQGKEYQKMLEKVNLNGRHSAKIAVIKQKLARAERALKKVSYL